uniref:Uncharacterized protein n=1 Tax=Manihot esculenta TaxID=3983 RepID=A0A2C9UKY0_MANES
MAGQELFDQQNERLRARDHTIVISFRNGKVAGKRRHYHLNNKEKFPLPVETFFSSLPFEVKLVSRN